MENKLNPCPKCGSSPTTSFNCLHGWQAYCSNDECELNLLLMYGKRTEDEAIAEWNRRVNDES